MIQFLKNLNKCSFKIYISQVGNVFEPLKWLSIEGSNLGAKPNDGCGSGFHQVLPYNKPLGVQARTELTPAPIVKLEKGRSYEPHITARPCVCETASAQAPSRPCPTTRFVPPPELSHGNGWSETRGETWHGWSRTEDVIHTQGLAVTCSS